MRGALSRGNINILLLPPIIPHVLVVMSAEITPPLGVKHDIVAFAAGERLELEEVGGDEAGVEDGWGGNGDGDGLGLESFGWHCCC